MTLALLFPGQGSQAIGMGKALAETYPAARAVFEEVDAALGQKLFSLMQDGPEADLNRTENTQPAIMACSVAAFRVMEQELGLKLTEVSYMAGHSLGEYSALTAAGAIDLSTTAKLLRIRGRAMQEAVPEGKGMMAAIIGPTLAEVEAIAAEAAAGGEVCDVANHNNDQQIVISGSVAGVEKAIEIAKAKGAKRAIPLQVSAPFHCALMAPAAKAMQAALAEATITAAQVPVIANFTAQPVSAPDDIRRLLVEQVTGRVRWQESVQFMAANGVTRMVEVGHGKVLSGLVKRIAPEVAMQNIGAPEDLASYQAAA